MAWLWLERLPGDNYDSYDKSIHFDVFPVQMMFTLLTVRSKSEDDALDAYTPSRRDTGSRRDTIGKKNESMLRRDISNASQISAGLSFCFVIHLNVI